VVQQLEAQGVTAHTASTNAELLVRLRAETLPATERRVVAFFTNGSFDGIIEGYLDAART